MNILYFDERELWSPKLDEILEELEDTEIKTINTKEMQSGKKFTISVASYFQPDQKFQISVAEE